MRLMYFCWNLGQTWLYIQWQLMNIKWERLWAVSIFRRLKSAQFYEKLIDIYEEKGLKCVEMLKIEKLKEKCLLKLILYENGTWICMHNGQMNTYVDIKPSKKWTKNSITFQLTIIYIINGLPWIESSLLRQKMTKIIVFRASNNLCRSLRIQALIMFSITLIFAEYFWIEICSPRIELVHLEFAVQNATFIPFSISLSLSLQTF